MSGAGKSFVARGLGLMLVLAAAAPAVGAREASGPRSAVEDDPGRILSNIRPDYRRYINALRPLDGAGASVRSRRVYMALVRPGADDPGSRHSAPFAGPGSRNDVLYDRHSISGDRSPAWSELLLDHEYFHARHLAGATKLPLPAGVSAEVEWHFFEAAAWAFNVAEARSSRYTGLQPDEFREALDHYGEHYRALRRLLRVEAPATWPRLADLLSRPDRFLRKDDPSR